MDFNDFVEDYGLSYPCRIMPGVQCSNHFHVKSCVLPHIEEFVLPKRKKPIALIQAPCLSKSSYEVTLTTTKDDPHELKLFMDKIINSRMFEIEYYEYVFELTEAGMPHIHAILYSKRDKIDGSQIKAKGIKFPYRYECKKVRNLNNYLIYIHKEKNNNIVLQYCLAKGINRHYARLPEVPLQENL